MERVFQGTIFAIRELKKEAKIIATTYGFLWYFLKFTTFSKKNGCLILYNIFLGSNYYKFLLFTKYYLISYMSHIYIFNSGSYLSE